MRQLKVLLIFTVWIFSPMVLAEYRIYELNIENVEKGTSRTVKSAIDNLQYPRLNPLMKNEVVRYVDSWMCYENMSSFRAPCSKPEPKSGSTSAPVNVK